MRNSAEPSMQIWIPPQCKIHRCMRGPADQQPQPVRALFIGNPIPTVISSSARTHALDGLCHPFGGRSLPTRQGPIFMIRDLCFGLCRKIGTSIPMTVSAALSACMPAESTPILLCHSNPTRSYGHTIASAGMPFSTTA